MPSSTNTSLQNLADDANTQKKCTNATVPTGAGSWLIVKLDGQYVYGIKHMGYGTTGTATTSRIKIAYGVETEPDTTVFTTEDNTEWLDPKDAVITLLGTARLAIKAESASSVVMIRRINRLVAGWEG